MADRRFALINKDISSGQIEDALNEDLTITGDWTFTGAVDLSGATLTLDEDYAILDADETVTGDWTFTPSGAGIIFNQSGNVFTDSAIRIEGDASSIWYHEADQATDEKNWIWGVGSKQFRLRTFTDAEGAGADPIQVTRGTGTAIDEIELNATTLDFNGDVDISGSLAFEDGVVASGTYTPTLTNGTNVADSTAFACQWMRVGNVITVSGQVNINPTAAAATVLTMSLPVAATFAGINECAGTAVSDTSGMQMANIRAATATGTAQFNYVSVFTGNTGFLFTFTYHI